jgi:hypothetical protein
MLALLVTPFRLAVTVATWLMVKAPAVVAKVALDAPLLTVTDAGIERAAPAS